MDGAGLPAAASSSPCRSCRRSIETILNEPLDKRNFRRKILTADVLGADGQHARRDHRPAKLYRFSAKAIEFEQARRRFPEAQASLYSARQTDDRCLCRRLTPTCAAIPPRPPPPAPTSGAVINSVAMAGLGSVPGDALTSNVCRKKRSRQRNDARSAGRSFIALVHDDVTCRPARIMAKLKPAAIRQCRSLDRTQA